MVAYKSAAKVETAVDWNGTGEKTYSADPLQAIAAAKDFINDMMIALDTANVVLAFSGQDNFRKKILPTYKSNRVDKHKPMVLQETRETLIRTYASKTIHGLEADDVMGIMMTRPHEGEYVMVAEDKDLRQIPGLLYNPRKAILETITEAEGDRWHLMQTLIGDSSDGYTGCPGVGPVKAERILNNCLPGTEWYAIVAAFKDCRKGTNTGYDEAYALKQAQVAKILRAENYNFDTKEPILWEPASRSTRGTMTMTTTMMTSPA